MIERSHLTAFFVFSDAVATLLQHAMICKKYDHIGGFCSKSVAPRVVCTRHPANFIWHLIKFFAKGVYKTRDK